MIYHIAARHDWEEAERLGAYTADSLSSEGFIHCSSSEQVIPVANLLFLHRNDLLLLTIDPARVEPEIRYENCEGGEERFPHVYGPLACSAVVDVRPFRPNSDGRFSEPHL